MEVKDYMNDFLAGAKKLADIVANKTQETVESAKIEIELRKAQANLDKEYKTLGQIEYHIEKGTMNRDDEVIEAACARIQDAIDAISALQAKKDAPKETEEAEAPVEAPEEAAEEASEEEEEPAEEDEEEQPDPEKNDEGYFILKFCPNCKVGNHPDAKKCVNCGTPFPEAEETESPAEEAEAPQSEEE